MDFPPQVVIMAGGAGTRLRPLTVNRPKPLVPVGNRPILHHLFDRIRAAGIAEAVLTTHYLAEEIEAACGDGADFGLRLHYAHEKEPLGTAGSVKNAEPFLKDGTLVVLSGDALTDLDLNRALAWHRERQAMVTLVLKSVPNPLEFGVVITAEDGRVERFVEKPNWAEVLSDTVNTGTYLIEREVLERIPLGEPCDWSRDVFPALLAEGKPVFGYVMPEYWSDIGTLQHYREAEETMLSGTTGLQLPGVEIEPGVWVDEGAFVHRHAQLIPPVVVGRDARIKSGATVGPFSSVGAGVVIEEDASIEQSMIYDNAYIGKGATVFGAIVGSRVTMKRESRALEGSVIGDRSLLDAGSTVRPRIKIWPDKIVDRGSTVTLSVVASQRWHGSLFRDLGVAGLSNIEVTPEFATRFGLALGSLLPQHSRIVTARDSARSSRMVKRAVTAGLLSTGCDVVDLQRVPIPVTRYYTKVSGATAGISVRKLPSNSRVTVMELLDEQGGYASRNLERKVESLFFREEFRRIDSDELGVIDVQAIATERYQEEFFHHVPEPAGDSPPRLVVDYGFSTISPIYPTMLGTLGVDTLSINAFNDARQAPREPRQIGEHLDNLADLMRRLDYDFAALFTHEGERLIIVDDLGRVVTGHALFAVMAQLESEFAPELRIAMPLNAPQRFEEALSRKVEIVRTRPEVRELMTAAHEQHVDMAGDEGGGFIYPAFHGGFDAMLALARLIRLLQRKGTRLSELVDDLPAFHLAYAAVDCPWDAKGAVMRALTEKTRPGQSTELMDGLKIFDEHHWVYVQPDAFEPMIHIYVESPDGQVSQRLAREYQLEISGFRERL